MSAKKPAQKPKPSAALRPKTTAPCATNLFYETRIGELKAAHEAEMHNRAIAHRAGLNKHADLQKQMLSDLADALERDRTQVRNYANQSRILAAECLARDKTILSLAKQLAETRGELVEVRQQVEGLQFARGEDQHAIQFAKQQAARS